MIQLSPCPFCGGTAEIDTQQGYRALGSGKIGSAVAIYCTQCEATMSMCREDFPELETEVLANQLSERWNRRENGVTLVRPRLSEKSQDDGGIYI